MPTVVTEVFDLSLTLNTVSIEDHFERMLWFI